MIAFFYDIMRRMQAIARRLWTAFLSGFFACILGDIQVLIFYNGKYLIPTLIFILVLAVICLGIAVAMFIYDVKHIHKRYKDYDISDLTGH
jgi:uncharacterized membrane protein